MTESSPGEIKCRLNVVIERLTCGGVGMRMG